MRTEWVFDRECLTDAHAHCVYLTGTQRPC